MKPVGGWGGVKLSITVGATTTTVTFDHKKAYCSQAIRKPVLHEEMQISGSDRQSLRGYRLEFKAYFENIYVGDDADVITLMQIIMLSQINGIPIRLWPKWNEYVPNPEYFDVLVPDRWSLNEINTKAPVGQRTGEIIFETQKLLPALPCMIEDRIVTVYSTVDDAVIIFGNNIAIEYTTSWRP